MAKQFLSLIVTFACIMWLADWVYDFGTSRNLNLKASYVANKPVNAEVVVVGSSNALYMINCEQLSNESGLRAYNLATTHASFTENYAHLYLYLQHNTAPKYLLIGITPADISIAGSAFHPYLFLPFTTDSCIKRLLLAEATTPALLNYIPWGLYAYYNSHTNYQAWQGLWHWVSSKSLPYYPYGSEPVPLNNRGFLEYESYLREHPGKTSYSWTTKNDNDLKSLISLALHYHIQPIVVNLPYWRGIDPHFEGKASVEESIKALTVKYKAQYWNFDTLSFCNDKNFFSSVFHTNAEGTHVLTHIVSEKMRH